MSAEADACKDTIATLRNLAAAAEAYPAIGGPGLQLRLRSLVPDPGMFSDGLEPLRARLVRGELFRRAVSLELEAAQRRLRCLPGAPCELCGNRVEPMSSTCQRCSAAMFRERR